jgi:hypothetical protein
MILRHGTARVSPRVLSPPGEDWCEPAVQEINPRASQPCGSYRRTGTLGQSTGKESEFIPKAEPQNRRVGHAGIYVCTSFQP